MERNESYVGQARCDYCAIITDCRISIFVGGYLKSCLVCKKPFVVLFQREVGSINMLPQKPRTTKEIELRRKILEWIRSH